MIARYLRSNKIFPFAIIASFFFWTLTLIHPYLFRWYSALMVQKSIPDKWQSYFELSVELLIILAISAFFIRFLSWAIMDISGELGSGKMLDEFIERIFRRKESEKLNEKLIDLKRVLSRDFYSIRSGLMAAIGDNIGAILELVIALIAILVIDIRLVLLFIPMMGLFFYLNKKVVKNLEKVTKREADALSKFLMSLEDSVSLRLESHFYDSNDWTDSRLQVSIQKWAIEIKKLTVYQGQTYLVQAISSRPILIGVILFGVSSSSTSELSQAALGSIISSLFMLNSALAQIGFTFNQFVLSREALARFYNLDRDLGALTLEPIKERVMNNEICLLISNLTVKMERKGSNKKVSLVYNLKLHEPGVILLQGPSGFGKSTLMKALAGQRSHEGKVVFGGMDLSTSNKEFKEKLIGYLPETSPAFPIKLDEFLGHDVLSSYSFLSHEETIENLGPSRRHLVFALKLLHSNKPILAFDEPTSVMDKEDLEIFKSSVQEAGKEKVIFIVSHQKFESKMVVDIQDICEVLYS